MSRRLKILSLFSGIGAYEKGLKNLGVDYELVGFSEIDESAITSYCAIHGVDESLNLGDVRNIKIQDLPKFDLLTFSFPCTDISKNGNLRGISDGTSSGLLSEALRIIKGTRPKYAIAENVKNLISKRFIDDFESLLEYMGELGYESSWDLSHATEYNVPQQRERVFMTFELGGTKLSFPKPINKSVVLQDFLKEDRVEDRFKVKLPSKFDLILPIYDQDGVARTAKVRQATKKGYDIANIGDSVNTSFPNSKTRRGRVGKSVVNTIETVGHHGVYLGDDDFRFITPLESYLLMGFSEEDYDKARLALVSKNPHKEETAIDLALYRNAGNSVVVTVLEEIFKEWFTTN